MNALSTTEMTVIARFHSETQFSRAAWILLTFLFFSFVNDKSDAAVEKSASDYGVDYAFLTLTALSPDFAATRYKIDNSDGSQVDINILRLPAHFELTTNSLSKLQLEVAAAYQRSQQKVQTFTTPSEYIDARWDNAGIEIGLLYERKLSQQFRFTPSLRLGATHLSNTASYHGAITNSIKDAFEGTLLNWNTDSAMLNLGLGASYHWKIMNRDSRIGANFYHFMIDSFHESNPAIRFREHANLLSIDADMIFPSHEALAGKRVDFIVLLGNNIFTGANRDTLGYTHSYRTGVGAELPFRISQGLDGHLRLSTQVQRAHNMRSWLLTLGYNTE